MKEPENEPQAAKGVQKIYIRQKKTKLKVSNT